ncbi:hypothetical protein OHW55_12180 [Acinetobacter baumannii]|nr:hypothetical protein [Acinetobacter baumannii]
MDNYKIKVKDEAESKEAQELFFELGYSWHGCGKYYNRIGNYTFITAYPDEMLLRMGWGGDTDKERTLPQLRDLVVLKRNDVRDATHTGTGDSKYYVDSNGDSYIHNSIIWTEWKLDISILKPIKKHLETATGRFDENGEHHLTFSKGLEEKDPALISGADALRALADGKDVQWATGDDFQDVTGQWEIREFSHPSFRFRLKPQTVKLEIELPKPFEPKEGDIYWFLSPFYSTGYDHCTFANDSSDKLHVQYGAYRSEDDVKKAVEQLRKIRGTNS